MRRTLFALFAVCPMLILMAAPGLMAADEAKPAPGNIKLPAGYVHEPLQGIDSIVGRITKKDGLTINYEIGRVTKPGQPALGGDFQDQAKAVPAAQRQWYQEQTIAGQQVHAAYDKQGMLIVTFPQSGVNFVTIAKTPAQVAEALLIVLSHQGKNAP